MVVHLYMSFYYTEQSLLSLVNETNLTFDFMNDAHKIKRYLRNIILIVKRSVIVDLLLIRGK